MNNRQKEKNGPRHNLGIQMGKQEPKVQWPQGPYGVVPTMGQGGKVASGAPNVSISACEVVYGLEPSSTINYHYMGQQGRFARWAPTYHQDTIRVGSHARSWHPKMGVTTVQPMWGNSHRCRGDLQWDIVDGWTKEHLLYVEWPKYVQTGQDISPWKCSGGHAVPCRALNDQLLILPPTYIPLHAYYNSFTVYFTHVETMY